MRLSDFKGEEAIEILAEIMEPASIIMGDPDVQRMLSQKGNSYLKIASFILKGHKKEILDMYEPLTKESRDEATPVKMIKLIMDIINDPEITSLFPSQSQDEALKSSGSAMENTEDGLK